MVVEGVDIGVINAETFTLRVIIDGHRLAFPVVVALDAEMVVPFRSEGRQAVTRLQQALGKGDAGRHAAAVHFRHGEGGIAVDITLLGADVRPQQRPCREGHDSQEEEPHPVRILSHHTAKITKIRYNYASFQTLRYCCSAHISSRYFAAAGKSRAAAAAFILRLDSSTIFST